MKINVSAKGDILIDDKIISSDEVSKSIELMKMALTDSDRVKKLNKEIETIRTDYNSHRKEITADGNE